MNINLYKLFKYKLFNIKNTFKNTLFFKLYNFKFKKLNLLLNKYIMNINSINILNKILKFL